MNSAALAQECVGGIKDAAQMPRPLSSAFFATPSF